MYVDINICIYIYIYICVYIYICIYIYIYVYIYMYIYIYILERSIIYINPWRAAPVLLPPSCCQVAPRSAPRPFARLPSFYSCTLDHRQQNKLLASLFFLQLPRIYLCRLDHRKPHTDLAPINLGRGRGGGRLRTGLGEGRISQSRAGVLGDGARWG